MINIIKQEITFDKSLKQRLKFICEFSHTTPTFINGYIEPHKIISRGIIFLAFNYSNEIYIKNLSQKIKISKLEDNLKNKCRFLTPKAFYYIIFPYLGGIMDKNFEVKYGYSSVIIEKDETKFNVEKSPDGDIWFNTGNSNIKLSISFYSRNQEEWRSYDIFENLMKSIVGSFILNGDDKDEYNLPKDFIDLKNKTITWHSDSEENNVLQLQFGEKEIIVSITRDENVSDRTYNNAIKVRIRTNGSSYKYYYQEFERFFNELSSYAYQVQQMGKRDVSINETKTAIQRGSSESLRKLDF